MGALCSFRRRRRRENLLAHAEASMPASEVGPRLIQCGLGRGLLPYQVAPSSNQWHLDASSRLATIKMGRKLGACPLFGGGKLGPHLAQCGLDQGLTSMPSAILIHPAVWPQ